MTQDDHFIIADNPQNRPYPFFKQIGVDAVWPQPFDPVLPGAPDVLGTGLGCQSLLDFDLNLGKSDDAPFALDDMKGEVDKQGKAGQRPEQGPGAALCVQDQAHDATKITGAGRGQAESAGIPMA